MNWLDIVIIVLFVISFLLGYKHGFFKEVFLTFKNIFIFIIAFLFKGLIGNLLLDTFGVDLPFNSYLSTAIGFIVIWITLSIILLVIEKTLTTFFDQLPVVNDMLRVFGGLIGTLKMYLFVFIVMMLLSLSVFNLDVVNQSMVGQYIVKNTPVISNYVLEETDALDKIKAVIQFKSWDDLTQLVQSIQEVELPKDKVNSMEDLNQLIQSVDNNDIINGGNDFKDEKEANEFIKNMIDSGLVSKEQVIEIANENINNDELLKQLLNGIE